MKRHLLLLCALLCAVSLPAQTWRRAVPRQPYIAAGENHIDFPGGKESFDRFFAKMDTVLLYGSGKLHILHIGGSHVQGGTWTAQLRRNLLLFRYGLDGGRGLVFPYSAAGTNTPLSYTTSYSGQWSSDKCLRPNGRLGITGMSVTTSDTTAILNFSTVERAAREWSPSFTFNRIEVLGRGTVSPVILMGRDTVRASWYDASRELWHFDLPRFTEEFSVGFTGWPGSFTFCGAYLDNPYSGITVSEAGVNGASTGSWRRCDDFGRDLKLLKPDLVIFSISINDIQDTEFDRQRFISNYGALVADVLKANPSCAILFTTNNDSFRRRSVNRQGLEAASAFEELGRIHHAGVWNLFNIMGGLGSIQSWEYAGWAQHDKIHFTTQGYDVVGNLLYNALMEAYREHVYQTDGR